MKFDIIILKTFSRKELDVMRLRNTYRVYGNMMEQTGFKLVYLAVIAPFVLGGGVLEAENVFFVMSACLLIRYTMGACAPNALFVGMETLIAIRRLQVRSRPHVCRSEKVWVLSKVEGVASVFLESFLLHVYPLMEFVHFPTSTLPSSFPGVSHFSGDSSARVGNPRQQNPGSLGPVREARPE